MSDNGGEREQARTGQSSGATQLGGNDPEPGDERQTGMSGSRVEHRFPQRCTRLGETAADHREVHVPGGQPPRRWHHRAPCLHGEARPRRSRRRCVHPRLVHGRCSPTSPGYEPIAPRTVHLPPSRGSRRPRSCTVRQILERRGGRCDRRSPCDPEQSHRRERFLRRFPSRQTRLRRFGVPRPAPWLELRQCRCGSVHCEGGSGIGKDTADARYELDPCAHSVMLMGATTPGDGVHRSGARDADTVDLSAVCDSFRAAPHTSPRVGLRRRHAVEHGNAAVLGHDPGQPSWYHRCRLRGACRYRFSRTTTRLLTRNSRSPGLGPSTTPTTGGSAGSRRATCPGWFHGPSVSRPWRRL